MPGCGSVERDWSFWMPMQLVKGEGNLVGEELRVGGVATDEKAEDLQGEIVFIKGLDTSYLENRGTFNWDHGKEPGDILGEIDKVNKDESSGKLYVEGFLYPHISKAQDVVRILKSLKATNSKRQLGMSIEGKVKERDAMDGKQIKKAWIKSVAITYHPINQGTFLDFVKSLGNFTFSKCDGQCGCGTCPLTKELKEPMEKSDTSDKIVEFLADNPNPPDDKIHALSEKLGIATPKFESMIYGMISDVIEHGKGGSPDEKELSAGIDVEKEHTKSPALAKYIAMAHLKEIPDYYTRLKAMEDAATRKEGEPVEKSDGAPAPAGEGGPGLAAGHDIPATSGGVSGSALRQESLETGKKGLKVTTWGGMKKKKDGITKGKLSEFLKSYYPADLAEPYAELIFELVREKTEFDPYRMHDLAKSDHFLSVALNSMSGHPVDRLEKLFNVYVKGNREYEAKYGEL